jgi:hypothetical protein
MSTGVATHGSGANPTFSSIRTVGDDGVSYDDTFWDDLRVPLSQTKLGANLRPDFDFTNVGLLFPQNDPTEKAYFVAQMPHEWKVGTPIFPHVHWLQSADTAVGWKLDYKVLSLGQAAPANFTTISGNSGVAAYVDTPIAQITNLGTGIDMSTAGLSALILGKLYRDDNLTTGDVLGFEIDFHFQLDAPGSRSPFAK